VRRWFSPGTPASSTTKTGRHYIAEILLKVALNTKIQIQILCTALFWLLFKEAGVPGENHRPWASNWLSPAAAGRVHHFL
jgi:hypothetical protein